MYLPLRNYSTIGRAQSYARKLQARFPDVVFVVVLSPFQSYAFRFLIKVQRGGRYIAGGTYVCR